ncbi:MAG: excisionase family DNA-binding protein [Myxococcales bacterium]
MQRRYFTTFEASHFLGVSLPTIVNWIKANRLKAHRTPGGHRRIAREELAGFIRRHGMPMPPELEGEGEAARIMVLHDDASQAHQLAGVLKKAGFESLSVTDLFAAGLRIGLARPDLVVVDLATKSADAQAVVAELRSHVETQHLPVLAVIGGGEAKGHKKALAAFDETLSRPLESGDGQEQGRRRPEGAEGGLSAMPPPPSSGGPAGADAVTHSSAATPQGRLEALAALVEVLSGPDGALPEALHRALRLLAPSMGADRCSVLVVENDSAALFAVATSDVAAYRKGVDLTRYPEVAEALRSRAQVLVRDAAADPLLAPVREAIAAAGVRTLLAVPLSATGVLLCRRCGQADAFDGPAIVLAQAAGQLVAAALETARRQAERERAAEREEARLRELEASLRRRQQACAFKDEAVRVFAHDVRSPLNILWGHARLLSDAGLEKAEEGSVQAIVRQGKKNPRAVRVDGGPLGRRGLSPCAGAGGARPGRDLPHPRRRVRDPRGRAGRVRRRDRSGEAARAGGRRPGARSSCRRCWCSRSAAPSRAATSASRSTRSPASRASRPASRSPTTG